MSQKPPSEAGAESTLNLKKFAAGTTEADHGQTAFIKKSADQLAANVPISSPEDHAFGIPVKDMLGMITYCYVRGVFSSKEISERLKNGPELRKAFGQKLPDEDEIKSFRRRHAAEIEDLLETVYRVYPTKTEPGATQTEIVHREAVERLHDAAWEDSMRRHLH